MIIIVYAENTKRLNFSAYNHELFGFSYYTCRKIHSGSKKSKKCTNEVFVRTIHCFFSHNKGQPISNIFVGQDKVNI